MRLGRDDIRDLDAARDQAAPLRICYLVKPFDKCGGRLQ